MPWDIRYKYVTTDGLPPLDGIPPTLALLQGQEEGYGYEPAVSTTSILGNGDDIGHQFAWPASLHPSKPPSVDPPPPYIATPLPTVMAMSVSHKKRPRARPLQPTISTRTTDRARSNNTGSIPDPPMRAMKTSCCYSYIPRSNIHAMPSHSDVNSCCHYYPLCRSIPRRSQSSSIPGNLPCTLQGSSSTCLSCQSQEELSLPLPIGSIIPGTRETSLVMPSSSLPPSGPGPRPRPQSGAEMSVTYIFPPNHATIHLIEPEYTPFKHSPPSPPPSFRFRIYKVPTSLTIAEFMRQVCFYNYNTGNNKVLDSNPEEMMTSPASACSALGNEVYAYGILENIELGDGRWARGQRFWVGGDNRILATALMRKRVQSLTLADVGWDETRGTDRARSVWISTTVVWE
jgi:hypothetical protein